MDMKEFAELINQIDQGLDLIDKDDLVYQGFRKLQQQLDRLAEAMPGIATYQSARASWLLYGLHKMEIHLVQVIEEMDKSSDVESEKINWRKIRKDNESQIMITEGQIKMFLKRDQLGIDFPEIYLHVCSLYRRLQIANSDNSTYWKTKVKGLHMNLINGLL